MSSYNGGVLAATTLPATAALQFVLINHANPAIVAGLAIVSTVGFITLIGQVSRYVVNLKKLSS